MSPGSAFRCGVVIGFIVRAANLHGPVNVYIRLAKVVLTVLSFIVFAFLSAAFIGDHFARPCVPRIAAPKRPRDPAVRGEAFFARTESFAILSTSCRSKNAFMRRMVDGERRVPFAMSRARAMPTAVPPRTKLASPFQTALGFFLCTFGRHEVDMGILCRTVCHCNHVVHVCPYSPIGRCRPNQVPPANQGAVFEMPIFRASAAVNPRNVDRHRWCRIGAFFDHHDGPLEGQPDA